MQKSYETGLVIFDKDGTLLDFKQTWLSIIGDLFKAIDAYQPMTEPLRKRIEAFCDCRRKLPMMNYNLSKKRITIMRNMR